MGYDSINKAVLGMVPSATQSVLDLGCGGGAMAELISAQSGGRVTGVTIDPEEATLARTRVARVEVLDLNTIDPSALGKFDCIVCSHVLEHLLAPERLLKALVQCLEPAGVLIVALPNILVWKQRLQFLRGRFRYTNGGLMDRTHFRFYDWETAFELLTGAGYLVVERRADGGFPLSRFLGSSIAAKVNSIALNLAPGLFGVQFVFRCKIKNAS